MIKLYYASGTRANKCRWTLEELGLPYELVRIDMKKGEHKAEAYRKIHPLGLIPALDDNGQVILESNAIILYLAERGLAPPPERRGPYYQWCVYVQGTLEPHVLRYFRHTTLLPEDQRREDAATQAQKDAREALGPVESALSAAPFLLGEFSAADVIMGSMLAWCEGLGLLDGFPHCQSYVKRLKERPARQRSYAD